MECRALAYDYNNFAGSWSAENRKLASTTLPFCFPPLLKYLCLFVYFYDFASMHKSVNVRQTTTDDGRWQADGGRDLITCSDKDTTDRTTWTTWALLLLLPKQVHRVSMFILRFNDYYQLLSNAAVKGANEGGRRERSHAPLPPQQHKQQQHHQRGKQQQSHHSTTEADGEQQPQADRRQTESGEGWSVLWTTLGLQ